jgi:xylan 1,4-beta-xylosidase
MPHLQLHYTEWSSSYTPADPIHDSYQEAPYILEKIKQTGDAANSMSYWTFTDIFEEAGPRFRPFHGGFGLMNYEGIKKPAFYAYAYLNKMGSTELEDNDSASWACRDRKGNIQVLFWNYTYTLPDSTNDQQYYIRNLPSKTVGNVKVQLTDIPEGMYSLEIYKIGYHVNDAYTTYLEMGKPGQLTRQEVAAIKQIDNGAPIRKEIVKITDKKAFSQVLTLRQNDVYLITLNKLN